MGLCQKFTWHRAGDFYPSLFLVGFYPIHIWQLLPKGCHTSLSALPCLTWALLWEMDTVFAPFISCPAGKLLLLYFPQILKASGLVQEPQIWANEVCTYRGFNCVFLLSAGEKVEPDACLLCSFREMAGCSTLSSEWENERMGKGWHRVGSCDT